MSTETRELVSETDYIESLPEPVRRYPVRVRMVSEHTIWVEGETQAEAVEWVDADHADLHDLIKDAEDVDGWADVEAVASVEIPSCASRIGPPTTCSECGDVAQDAVGYIRHKGTCSLFMHGASLWTRVRDEAGKDVGMVATCYCGWPWAAGTRAPHPAKPDELPDGVQAAPVGSDREQVNAPLREHLLAMPYRSKHAWLGIEECRPERVR